MNRHTLPSSPGDDVGGSAFMLRFLIWSEKMEEEGLSVFKGSGSAECPISLGSVELMNSRAFITSVTGMFP